MRRKMLTRGVEHNLPERVQAVEFHPVPHPPAAADRRSPLADEHRLAARGRASGCPPRPPPPRCCCCGCAAAAPAGSLDVSTNRLRARRGGFEKQHGKKVGCS